MLLNQDKPQVWALHRRSTKLDLYNCSFHMEMFRWNMLTCPTSRPPTTNISPAPTAVSAAPSVVPVPAREKEVCNTSLRGRTCAAAGLSLSSTAVLAPLVCRAEQGCSAAAQSRCDGSGDRAGPRYSGLWRESGLPGRPSRES